MVRDNRVLTRPAELFTEGTPWGYVLGKFCCASMGAQKTFVRTNKGLTYKSEEEK